MSGTGSSAWQDLDSLAGSVGQSHVRELLRDDSQRTDRMVATGAGVTLDYSRQRVDPQVISALLRLVQERDVLGRRDQMFAGDRINVTENRSVLHTALRLPRDASLVVDGEDVVPGVHEVLDRMAAFSERVRSGDWVGHTGKRMRNIVNIGIGGSDLGPVMAYQALRSYSDRDLVFRFVSNVDGNDIAEALRDLDPAETLIIACSKTFTTLETMTNAAAARDWVREGLGDDADVAKHFVAVSTNHQKVAEFGIDPENMFGFWEWVGGRYSMMSAIGLSTMIAIGPDGFRDMLAGAHAMDEHFRTAPPDRNLPVLMGGLTVWNRNFLDYPTVAVLPYDQYLSRFPAYLQQMIMESNGKRVRLDGTAVDYDTSPIYWGEPGTNGQHSFYQLIHQGTSIIPCDVMYCIEANNEVGDQHDLLIANALAQAAVFSLGRTEEEVRADGVPEELVPHKVMPGNRPCSVLTVQRLTPAALGALVALYEHSVFVSGAIWDLDPYDQWGVELGKVMAMGLVPQLRDGESAPEAQDAATTAAVARYRDARG